MLSNYSSGLDTPEIQRIKITQQNISAVSNNYCFSVGTLKFCFQKEGIFPHCLIVALFEFSIKGILFPSLK